MAIIGDYAAFAAELRRHQGGTPAEPEVIPPRTQVAYVTRRGPVRISIDPVTLSRKVGSEKLVSLMKKSARKRPRRVASKKRPMHVVAKAAAPGIGHQDPPISRRDDPGDASHR